jgi:hypothetical protein
MEIVVGFLGAVLGALAGAVATYATTRSTMRLELEHTYDQALRNIRLPHYQRLFHISKCIPRAWGLEQLPTRQDLLQFREDFHNWYFGEDAGGMFMTEDAKNLLMKLQNLLEATGSKKGTSLSCDEQLELRTAASNLRHQLTWDIGAAQPPRIAGAKLGPTLPPPSKLPSSSQGDKAEQQRPR